ncbi:MULTISPECIES: cyclodeaminase/cyclohydrolase family protein [unclassified Nocardiopsis]|uniref:cyclodeaminase/cyclohydrolase family protein n=1 Tax=Nocardiopsis TaxID=2013 RepID=UPI00387B1D9E
MRDEPIGAYLHRLAAREPAPGGGAAAALHAAQGAALVAMVARYTSGPKYAQHAEQIERITGRADALAERALGLAAEDETAFGDVAAAYKLPRDTEADKAARSAAIAEATVGATVPPAEVIAVSGEIVALAEALLPIGNPNVVTDIAAAAEAARAAATTSRVNIEINLAGVEDPDRRADLRAVAAEVDDISAAVEKITARVREVISR